ncbi:hypothetical protein AKJ16_DCAP27597 [Drosera capensis]
MSKRSAIELQQGVSGSASALMTGYFHGIKVILPFSLSSIM